ncbi:MAG: hypothetical protein KAR07_07245 [Spirochaetes bacterium]|nr:hypothetical protein [Spirochaetota bacterium]
MYKKMLMWMSVFLLINGCSLFQSSKSDIRKFDRSYLEDKFVGKTGWARVNLGGVKTGGKLTINGIDFGPRTIVRIKTGGTDHYFIIYSNKNLNSVKPDKVKVEYDIRQIEKEITDKVSFIAP